MRKFWLASALLLCSVTHIHAFDFTIRDATVTGTYIDVTGYLGSTSNYYLQGGIRSTTSDYYFGQTQNNKGDWIDYFSSAEKEYISDNLYLTQAHNLDWSDIVHLRFTPEDPNYKGPGQYRLELRRYTGGGKTSAGESNVLLVNLTASTPTPNPSTTPIPSPSPSPTPTPTSTPSPTVLPTPTPTLKPTIKPSPSPSPELSPASEGTVAGVATEINLTGFGISPSPAEVLEKESSTSLTLNTSRAKTVISIGFGLVLISLAGFFGYRKYLKSTTILE